jgi:hypothetical protein
MSTFFKREFGKGQGAFSYLSGLSSASDGLKLAVETTDVDVRAARPTVVWRGDGVTISAFGIPHGDVPTLAYRIETPKGVIVLSADQNGSRKAFVDFARGADILMMPAAIDNDADAASRFLHATPDAVGRIAAQVAPRMLVLDHFMGRCCATRTIIFRSSVVFTMARWWPGAISPAFPSRTDRSRKGHPMKHELILGIAMTSLVSGAAAAARHRPPLPSARVPRPTAEANAPAANAARKRSMPRPNRSTIRKANWSACATAHAGPVVRATRSPRAASRSSPRAYAVARRPCARHRPARRTGGGTVRPAPARGH